MYEINYASAWILSLQISRGFVFYFCLSASIEQYPIVVIVAAGRDTCSLAHSLSCVGSVFFFLFFIYASISSFALFFAFKRRCCCVLFFCAFFQHEFSSLFFSTSLSLRTDLEQVQAQWHACLFVVLRFGSSAPFRLFQLVVLGLSHCAASLRLPLPIFLCASLPSECLPKTARVFTSSLRYSGNLTSSDTPLINKK